MSMFSSKQKSSATSTVTAGPDAPAVRPPLPEPLREFDSMSEAELARLAHQYWDGPNPTVEGYTRHEYEVRLERARTARENQIEADRFTKSMSSWMDCRVCGQGRAFLSRTGEDYGMCPPCGAIAQHYQLQAVGTQSVGGRNRGQAVLDHIRKAATANPKGHWAKYDLTKVNPPC